MNTYKAIYAKNKVVSCANVGNNVTLNEPYVYEHDKGQLIYALIQASSVDHAYLVAQQIVGELNEKMFGTDFVS